MTLIIAEKPSVGRAIAEVIGADKKEQGFLSGSGFIVSWAYGHLVQAASPKYYDDCYAKMSIDDLPIIPGPWLFAVPENKDSLAQYNLLKKLMHRADVKYVICATDAGREGELIFRLIYEHAGCKKPVRRLWVSSLEPKAISDGMQSLKPGSDYDNLYAAASSRQKADWLYGMNMTRLFSCLYGKASNGFINIINVGRVQTPTINFIVERQREIDHFIPRKYYSVIADCGGFRAYTKVNDKNTADAIMERCSGKDAYVTKLEKTDKKESAPVLFDLTSLQREANRLYGYSAQETLDTLQKLYEAKLSTYPRTDSNYITEDMEGPVYKLVCELIGSDCYKGLNAVYNIKKINIRAVINNKKVTDHFAILPTEAALKANTGSLPEQQQNILRLIICRLLCAVYTPRLYTAAKIYLDVEGEAFTATGTQTQDMGFSAIQKMLLPVTDREKEDTENAAIPAELSEGGTIPYVQISAKEKHTKPPKPYDENMLLSALERAGSELSEEALKEAIKGSGLGTPATRAGIIEGTISNGYIVRKGGKKVKTLHPTDKAIALMDVIDDNLKSAVMTAEWEKKLSGIEAGTLTETEFITAISDFVSKKVHSYRLLPQTDNPFESVFQKDFPERKALGKCPKCGGCVYEGKKAFFCENAVKKDNQPAPCNFFMYMEDKFFTCKGKTLTPHIATMLLSHNKAVLKGCKPKDAGKQLYDISVSMEITGKYVNYKMEFLNTGKKKGV